MVLQPLFSSDPEFSSLSRLHFHHLYLVHLCPCVPPKLVCTTQGCDLAGNQAGLSFPQPFPGSSHAVCSPQGHAGPPGPIGPPGPKGEKVSSGVWLPHVPLNEMIVPLLMIVSHASALSSSSGRGASLTSQPLS